MYPLTKLKNTLRQQLKKTGPSLNFGLHLKPIKARKTSSLFTLKDQTYFPRKTNLLKILKNNKPHFYASRAGFRLFNLKQFKGSPSVQVVYPVPSNQLRLANFATIRYNSSDSKFFNFSDTTFKRFQSFTRLNYFNFVFFRYRWSYYRKTKRVTENTFNFFGSTKSALFNPLSSWLVAGKPSPVSAVPAQTPFIQVQNTTDSLSESVRRSSNGGLNFVARYQSLNDGTSLLGTGKTLRAQKFARLGGLNTKLKKVTRLKRVSYLQPLIPYGVANQDAHNTYLLAGFSVFLKAVQNVLPKLEVRSKRVAGSTFKIPFPIKLDRQYGLAIRWLILSARQRSQRNIVNKLSSELLEASHYKGNAVKKKLEMHRSAFANRAYLHYRWS